MTDGHEGNDPMGAPTLHRGLLDRCPSPECEDRALDQQDDDAEPEPTEMQKAYNVAQGEMFQLAAYGDCKYWPLKEALTDEGRRQMRDYHARLRNAQTRFEAADLMKSAEYFQSVLDAAQVPEENPHYWAAVQHMVQGLRCQANDLLKEL